MNQGVGGFVEVVMNCVDHPPLLECGGVVEVAGHDEFTCPARTRSLRETLRATHRRRQAHHGLDESKFGVWARQDEVAGQGYLEGGGERQTVRCIDDWAG